MRIVPINTKMIEATLAKRRVVVIVGMYGTGKGLIADYLACQAEDRADNLERVSCKDLPDPTMEDIPAICGERSYALLHAKWRRAAERAGKNGRNLVIIIEEADKLVESGAKLWEVLFSLLYYQKGKVQIVITAQPRIIEASDLILRRVMRGCVFYPRQLTLQETINYLDNSRYSRAIHRLSHGHYGTVKYLSQLIHDNKYLGERLTENRVQLWASERGEMEYFVRSVWQGLGLRQQGLIRQYIQGNKLVGGAGDELVKVGVLWWGGKGYRWCVPWTLPFVKDFLSRFKWREKEIRLEEMEYLGKKERLILHCMLSARGETVSYDRLGDEVWGKDNVFSLWALSRLVGRVKSKLRARGYGEMIMSVRGVGYKLS